ncbi:MAG: undecaprenyl-diphosphate phosphatase [Cryomorphaceae bacterium]|nr:MAG: undecaprenyl-diphosphate phosphatase [Cryomorphaceae bacterium]
MSIIEAIILGIIQGLTEFLPVSSSGHLEIGKAILGDESLPAESLMFTVVVHAATALSTIVVYRKDVAELLRGIFQFRINEETLFAWKVVISMVPAAFIGVFFNDEIEALFDGQLLLVGGMLAVTGLLLFLADKARHTDKPVSPLNAAIIGIAQAIAILPGISRSGATIATSVMLGVDRAKAARFSFLMVVPLILGKMAKDILDGGLSLESSQTPQLAAGFITAFIAGVFACRVMIALVKKSKLVYFSVYCFAVSLAVILYTLFV